MSVKQIHYGSQHIDDQEINQVIGVLKSDFLSSGPKIKEFEERMQALTGAKYCAAVANGTAALHLAVKALDLPAGKRGITSPITFVASANSFVYNGLKPDFADIDPRTYCMDPVELEKRIDGETGVVIPVHFTGQTAHMEAISAIAKRNGAAVIEDAAHAIGSTYENGETAGSCCYSDMTIFSFHPVKTITTGEGGAITTNDKTLYEKLTRLRNHGLTKDSNVFKNKNPDWIGPWYYEMHEPGFNYRMTDIQAALGIGQLNKLEGFIRRRQEICAAYDEAFKNLDWLTMPYRRPGVVSVLHLYVILIDFKALGKSRTQVMAELREKGINTQVHYIPVHYQPYYRETFGFNAGDFPKSEAYYSQCLSIPLYPRMTDDDIRRVISAVSALGKGEQNDPITPAYT